MFAGRNKKVLTALAGIATGSACAVTGYSYYQNQVDNLIKFLSK